MDVLVSICVIFMMWFIAIYGLVWHSEMNQRHFALLNIKDREGLLDLLQYASGILGFTPGSREMAERWLNDQIELAKAQAKLERDKLMAGMFFSVLIGIAQGLILIFWETL